MAKASFERVALRLLAKAPGALVNALGAGEPNKVGGRTLDPHLRMIARASRLRPSVTTMPAAKARAVSAHGFKQLDGDPEPGVASEDFSIDGPGGDLAIRSYRPERRDPGAPLMVYYHMGGGVIGDLGTHHAFCTMIASTVGCPIISVDYRLAPEHPCPAGLEDALAAYRWGRDHAHEFGAPAGLVMVGGDSMGGDFAAVVPQEMKRCGEPQPALQMLCYPALDLSEDDMLPSIETYADAFPLSRDIMEWFRDHYLGDCDPNDPRYSPLREPDVGGLAPAVIATAGFDPIVDQGEAYAQRLAAVGVPVTYRCYDGLVHGFTAMTGAVPAADAAAREIARLVRARLDADARAAAA